MQDLRTDLQVEPERIHDHFHDPVAGGQQAEIWAKIGLVLKSVPATSFLKKSSTACLAVPATLSSMSPRTSFKARNPLAT